MIEHFDTHNVGYISVTERFDTSTPAGRLLRNIMLTFADYAEPGIMRTRRPSYGDLSCHSWHFVDEDFA
jgi:hypothetical protein